MKTKKSIYLSPIKRIATVGIMAATVECGKLAMAVFPNIEVVSLFLALYGYSFGSLGVLAAFVFCAIEPLIWGFGPWVISYFLYWPLIPLVFGFLGKLRSKIGHTRIENTSKKRIFSLSYALVISGLTLWFGILTSLIDVGLLTGNYESFFFRFGVYYLRGIPFYITHLVSNFLIFFFSFKPLSHLFLKIKKGF